MIYIASPPPQHKDETHEQNKVDYWWDHYFAYKQNTLKKWSLKSLQSGTFHRHESRRVFRIARSIIDKQEVVSPLVPTLRKWWNWFVKLWNDSENLEGSYRHLKKTLMELECYLCRDATKNKVLLDILGVILIPKQKGCRMSWSSYKIWKPNYFKPPLVVSIGKIPKSLQLHMCVCLNTKTKNKILESSIWVFP